MYSKQNHVIALFITGKQGSKALCRNICVNDQAYLVGSIQVCGGGKQERFRTQCSLKQQHLASGPVGRPQESLSLCLCSSGNCRAYFLVCMSLSEVAAYRHRLSSSQDLLAASSGADVRKM